MHLREVSYALKALAEVAHAGEELVGSMDRSRSRSPMGALLVGVGIGVGVGALLFSEPARRALRTWLVGTPVAARANGVEPVPAAAEAPREAAPAPH